MIFNIKISNWMSHSESEFDFSEGLNLIFGENGSGKSSILYAIYYALTGKSPIKGLKIKDFLRKNSEQGTIEIWF